MSSIPKTDIGSVIDHAYRQINRARRTADTSDRMWNVITDRVLDDIRNPKPRYAHDCGACTFLGWHNEYDLYHCAQGGIVPTVIARFGSEGHEYLSGMDAIAPALEEAQRRAKRQGLAVAARPVAVAVGDEYGADDDLPSRIASEAPAAHAEAEAEEPERWDGLS